MATVDDETDLEHDGPDLERVVDKLAVRYPDHSRESLRQAVEQAQLHFSEAKVHEYLSVLIERRVRAGLLDVTGGNGPREAPAAGL